MAMWHGAVIPFYTIKVQIATALDKVLVQRKNAGMINSLILFDQECIGTLMAKICSCLSSTSFERKTT